MIKLIIFDIGGVLMDFTEDSYIAYIAGRLGMPITHMRRAILPLVTRMELGRLDLRSAERKISKALRIPKVDLEWDSAFKVLASRNDRVIALEKKLHSRYRIVLLTNISESRYELTARNILYDVPRERVFTSCRLHMAKPGRRIYRHVLDSMGAKPGEALFIDNTRENVDGARAIGITSIWFRNYGQLVSRLKRLKVI